MRRKPKLSTKQKVDICEQYFNTANLKVTKNAENKFTNIGKFISAQGYFLYTVFERYIKGNIMNRNLLGELRIMKDYGIKPNYSALQREYGIDRHTIKNTMTMMAFLKEKVEKEYPNGTGIHKSVISF